MGQKVNPVSLRLQYTNRHFDSCWYSDSFYKNLLTRDVFLQHYLNTFLRLLKLPAGRYSIQHLHKKTQIFNFLCIPKSSREWRAKLCGFTPNKNVHKKNRYFFKKKTDVSLFGNKNNRRIRKQTKLHCFYTTLNQLAVHQIQKKITSFQNFRLWSGLIKPKQKLLGNNSKDMVLVSSSFPSNPDHWKKHDFHWFYAFPRTSLLTLSFWKQKEWLTKISKNGLLKLEKSPLLKKLPHSGVRLLSLEEQSHESHLLFLQNLGVYKTLKATLVMKDCPRFTLEEAPKSRSFLGPKQNLEPKHHVVDSPSKTGFSSLSNFQTLESKYKNYLESSLSSFYGLHLDLLPFRVKNDWQYAGFLADEIVSLLEKRIAFRRLKSKLIKQLSKVSAIRGVRITCSGRVGGKSKKAQRAKIESLKYGQTSLHVFSAPIDFSCKTARTSFGSVGVKVWICYQENLETHSFGVQKESH